MGNPTVSVLIPSNRPDRLDLARQSLKRQTYEDFEVLICSPFDPGFGDRWVPDTFEGGFWSLNRAYNALFKEARGALFVTLQDSIWIQPDSIEKFWYGYESTKGCISGVGDQYSGLDDLGKPTGKVWSDPRKTRQAGAFYECYPNDIEFNHACFPKKAAFEVGGFDEGLDFLGYGGDQLQFMERVGELGYKTYLDQTNESFTLQHGRKEGWDDNHVLFNGVYDKRKEELITQGLWPRLNYL